MRPQHKSEAPHHPSGGSGVSRPRPTHMVYRVTAGEYDETQCWCSQGSNHEIGREMTVVEKRTGHTPSIDTLRIAWSRSHPFPESTDIVERYAEFDRAIANHDAATREESTADMRHAPWRAPEYWDWRCRICGEPVSDHPSLWRRILARLKRGRDVGSLDLHQEVYGFPATPGENR